MPNGNRGSTWEFRVIALVSAAVTPAALLVAACGGNVPWFAWFFSGCLGLRSLNLAAGIRNNQDAVTTIITTVARYIGRWPRPNL